MSKYTALGLMSGSSLDGLDIAYCEFCYESNRWDYKIINAKTYDYTDEWRNKLSRLGKSSAKETIEANVDFGRLCADFVNNFIDEVKAEPQIIASHGHTIFHEPAKGYSCQIGDGQIIAANCGIKTINDFRSKDISLGGQGAPLVPIGDELLFDEFDFCLNIGGIANISFRENNQRIAFDICGANQLLNHLSLQLGKPFDEGGHLSQKGKMNNELFNTLNADAFFKLKAPKSLSNQYVTDIFRRLLDSSAANIEDKLFTVSKHIAHQINESVKNFPEGRMLISGGGANNNFLINCIIEVCKHEVIIPDNTVIDFKEALIFAFMGVLKTLGKPNCLASVTGAVGDCSGGLIYLPK